MSASERSEAIAGRHEFLFGQPEGGILQIAYVVADLAEAMEQFATRFGVGPFFVRGPFIPPAGRYRGEPTDIELSLARAWSGHVMVELICQHDEKPSVYLETVRARGYGFHHWATGTRDFDAVAARYRRFGYEESFSDCTPSGRRVAYFDAPDLAGMIEVIEMTEEQERFYDAMRQVCAAWDGTRLARDDSELLSPP